MSFITILLKNGVAVVGSIYNIFAGVMPSHMLLHFAELLTLVLPVHMYTLHITISDRSWYFLSMT